MSKPFVLWSRHHTAPFGVPFAAVSTNGSAHTFNCSLRFTPTHIHDMDSTGTCMVYHTCCLHPLSIDWSDWLPMPNCCHVMLDGVPWATTTHTECTWTATDSTTTVTTGTTSTIALRMPIPVLLQSYTAVIPLTPTLCCCMFVQFDWFCFDLCSRLSVPPYTSLFTLTLSRVSYHSGSHTIRLSSVNLVCVLVFY